MGEVVSFLWSLSEENRIFIWYICFILFLISMYFCLQVAAFSIAPSLGYIRQKKIRELSTPHSNLAPSFQHLLSTLKSLLSSFELPCLSLLMQLFLNSAKNSGKYVYYNTRKSFMYIFLKKIYEYSSHNWLLALPTQSPKSLCLSLPS